MKLPAAVTSWCQQQGRSLPSSHSALAGGCIADTQRLHWSDGFTAILKQDPQAPADQFAAEAAGLNALRAANALRIPEVYTHSATCLLLEDLPPAPRGAHYWQDFGRGLAQQHAAQEAQFGFAVTTYCGSTAQDNTWHPDGHRFYAEQRLLPLGRACQQAGLLTSEHGKQLEQLCHKLPQLIPPQPASLLHGDLWSGNAHTGPQGEPALIDPACYYGWPEAELAMTKLFGGFSEAFYAAYAEASGIDGQWSQRSDIYNLYHLLNHAVLFGGGYVSQVLSTMQRYC